MTMSCRTWWAPAARHISPVRRLKRSSCAVPWWAKVKVCQGESSVRTCSGVGAGGSIAEAAAARFLRGGIRAEEQMRVLAEAADGGGVGGKVAEHGAGWCSLRRRQPGGGGAAEEGSASRSVRSSRICSRARWLRRAARTSSRYCLLFGWGWLFCPAWEEWGHGGRRPATGGRSRRERGEREKFGESVGRARSWFGNAGRADRVAKPRRGCGGRSGAGGNHRGRRRRELGEAVRSRRRGARRRSAARGRRSWEKSR